MSEPAGARIQEVEARSAGFRKELGLRDLVLTQILYVVGSAWVGTAAKLGTSHIVFWLMAIGLYCLPKVETQKTPPSVASTHGRTIPAGQRSRTRQ